MVKAKAKKVQFLAHEIALTFIGAAILSFALLAAQAGGWNWLVTVVAVWLGLLVFTLPVIWKIEKLM